MLQDARHPGPAAEADFPGGFSAAVCGSRTSSGRGGGRCGRVTRLWAAPRGGRPALPGVLGRVQRPAPASRAWHRHGGALLLPLTRPTSFRWLSVCSWGSAPPLLSLGRAAGSSESPRGEFLLPKRLRVQKFLSSHTTVILPGIPGSACCSQTLLYFFGEGGEVTHCTMETLKSNSWAPSEGHAGREAGRDDGIV